MKEHRGFKYRIYPTAQQKVLFERTFGCCRFVYNKVLEEQIRLYESGAKKMAKYASFKWMTANLKPAFPFLQEVDATALMNSTFHLHEAYNKFFQKTGGFPKFKQKRKSKQSYTASCNKNSIRYTEDSIRLPIAGTVKAKMHRLPPEGYAVKSATVSRDSKGEYFCSILCERETEEMHISTTTADKVLGLDYKSEGLYTDSEGRCADMPKYFSSTQEKLARKQRELSFKKGSKKGERKSKNYQKQKYKVNKCYVKITNQRNDFLHKESALIAKKYDYVIVEDIDMTEIASSDSLYHLGKATLDNGYGKFRTMLEYKLKAKGGELIKTDRYFASSQICSHCGHVNPKVKDLSVRNWVCPKCGTHHNRDHNAAINEKKEGIRLLKEMGVTVLGDTHDIQGWNSPVLPACESMACGSEVVA